ncbi:MAG: L-aspartate oxidase [Chloroflexota bacterium]
MKSTIYDVQNNGELIETDVLIIGCGVGGSTAALTLADAGIAVTIITRSQMPQESNTYYAQGGIIYRGVEDSPDLLYEDIIRAGAGHSNPRAVRLLSEEGPEAVRRVLLERVEVDFDANDSGDLSLVLEGGHSVPRILHTADATGRAIEIALLNALVEHPNITLFTECTAVDLLTPDHQSTNRLTVYDPPSCMGAYLLDQRSGTIFRCVAKKTVLASGGLGQIFLRTTNPIGARGDGIAMAYRAGLRIINAEFVQFHPTTFYNQNAARFLVSEAVRGEGARVVNANGEPFMDRYAPEWKDLAPRDVVARSIHREMLENDVTNVYLDLYSYIAKDEILKHFPTIYQRCLEFGVDMTKDLVPIVPAAHYSCGGIWVDEWGLTTCENLYAVGEVACTGLHGANRLASTSLLEGLVWGQRAAKHMQSLLPDQPHADASQIPAWESSGIDYADPALISQDMSAIKNIMWNYVGLVRNTRRLERAMRDLRQLEIEIERFYRRVYLNDEMLGLRNSARTAIIVATAAWRNRTSMGCHYRE